MTILVFPNLRSGNWKWSGWFGLPLPPAVPKSGSVMYLPLHNRPGRPDRPEWVLRPWMMSCTRAANRCTMVQLALLSWGGSRICQRWGTTRNRNKTCISILFILRVLTLIIFIKCINQQNASSLTLSKLFYYFFRADIDVAIAVLTST